MTAPLPPLTLDDIRCSAPDRDSEQVFYPEDTWRVACEKIEAGYSAAAVVDVLMMLDDDEKEAVRDWWGYQCSEVFNEGQGRDALCPDLLLCQAIDQSGRCGRDWPLPPIDATTVLPLLAKVDSLRATLNDMQRHIDGARLELHRMTPVDFRDGLASWSAFITEALKG